MKTPQIIWRLCLIISLSTNGILFADKLLIQKIIDDLQKPVFLTAPINGTDTLFIVEQHGIIWTFIDGELLKEPLLDIKDRVHQPKMPGDERGLLGMALHPQFRKNGQLFVNYINQDDYSIISRFEVNLVSYNGNAKSEQIIIKIKQPYSNHTGGHLTFGPDKKLYIGFGDGGYAGDPHENGQNNNTIFGSILRIDVDQLLPYFIPIDNPFYGELDVRQEIWCYGLRNPWRFSFDRMNGDLYIGDVGQSNWEEINYSSFIDVSGANFGWNKLEGAHCYPMDEECDNTAFTMPVFEYPNNANYMKTLIGFKQNNAKGCSVTGGYVYRGAIIEQLQGHYVFGDYCTGKLWSFKIKDGVALDYLEWEIKGKKDEIYISSFGEDGLGELYILNHTGSIYKITGVEN